MRHAESSQRSSFERKSLQELGNLCRQQVVHDKNTVLAINDWLNIKIWKSRCST